MREDIEFLDKGSKTKALLGLEPSGVVHLGHYFTLKRLKNYSNQGLQIHLIISDLHAQLNKKPLYKQKTEACMKFFQIFMKEAKIHQSSTFFNDPNYFKMFVEFSTYLKIRDTYRGLGTVEKELHPLKTSLASHVYSVFQCVDSVYLDCDLVLAGKDQRNIYMIGYNHFQKLNWPKPSIEFFPLLNLEGGTGPLEQKMSSSGKNVPLDGQLYKRVCAHLINPTDSLFLALEKNKIYELLDQNSFNEFLLELKKDLEPLQHFSWVF